MPRIGATTKASAQMKTKRTTTGAVAGAATAEVTVTWPTAFADTNYTAVVSLLETTAAGTNTLQIRRIRSQTAEAITVVVVNNDAITARTGTLHAVGVHD